MNTAIIVSLLLCALPAGSMADKPKVTRTMLDAMEKSVDGKLQSLFTPEPAEIVGVTQSAYINGYGAVFMSEVNLAPAPGISPFHPTLKGGKESVKGKAPAALLLLETHPAGRRLLPVVSGSVIIGPGIRWPTRS